MPVPNGDAPVLKNLKDRILVTIRHLHLDRCPEQPGTIVGTIAN